MRLRDNAIVTNSQVEEPASPVIFGEDHQKVEELGIGMQVMPPPFWELEADLSSQRVPVAGLLADYVGPLLTIEDLTNRTDIVEEKGFRGIRSIQAYSIPKLLGRLIPATTATRMAGDIGSFLAHELPGWAWNVPAECWIPKFGICHFCIPAPPDTFERPMALELFGEAESIGDIEMAGWSALDRSRSSGAQTGEQPVSIRICSATYANVAHLAYDVPFYT